MAYFVGLATRVPIGGIICVSGWCPCLHHFSLGEMFCRNSLRQVLYLHGDENEVLDVDYALNTYDEASPVTNDIVDDPEVATERFRFACLRGLGHEAHEGVFGRITNYLECCMLRNPRKSLADSRSPLTARRPYTDAKMAGNIATNEGKIDHGFVYRHMNSAERGHDLFKGETYRHVESRIHVRNGDKGETIEWSG
ncbi:acyl-protein thioesterase related protein [Cyclospora cayetanensis]|uniref:Acyl-protein thioesterase related protein n=1 Tax=Cyclospora cayetanensis TaxID=88456 RepID=A0A1D3CW73_9EIME|nr:acyl-protein thioesterase related protein [Cyclospora cayetanensis]